MKPYSRVYAAINLDAVAANMEAMKANLPASTSMIGVVKTDGYGHGAVPVAGPLTHTWTDMPWHPWTKASSCAATAYARWSLSWA